MRIRGRWQEGCALGFCVSVKHADFMARKFNALGIPAMAIHKGTSDSDRETAPSRLQRREVNVLFTCDLYNEGVDFPFVDTILLLRPTSSATVFLQQLGRGLRLDEGKQSCLVLDFIGQHRQEFRFDTILTGMTGIPRGRLTKAVQDEFPTLPSGCHLQLDKVAREKVLESLKQSIGGGQVRLSRELIRLGPVSLSRFLEDTGRDLDEIYDAGGWTALRRAAGQVPGPAPVGEPRLNKALRFLIHIDEAERLRFYRELGVSLKAPSDAISNRRLFMLGYLLYHQTKDVFRPSDVPERLRAFPALCDELKELSDVLLAQSHPTQPPMIRDGWPLALHRRYVRREIQTAVGHWTESRKPLSREGVISLDDLKCELLLVTIDKSEDRFSPTTRYKDYAISPDKFHWQSQSPASETSDAGRRYIEQSTNGWSFYLFVRSTIHDPYFALGSVKYESHTGNRPMNVIWKVEPPLPPHLFELLATLLAA